MAILSVRSNTKKDRLGASAHAVGYPRVWASRTPCHRQERDGGGESQTIVAWSFSEKMPHEHFMGQSAGTAVSCLLYTSDAADE